MAAHRGGCADFSWRPACARYRFAVLPLRSPPTLSTNGSLSVAVLMPVHNESTRLAQTLVLLRERSADLGRTTVFLVDDGSEPSIDPLELPAPTADFKITLARHAVNLGQGA